MENLEIAGLSELRAKLRLLKGVNLTKVASAGAYKLQALAEPLVPVDTGALKNNVSVDALGDSGASLTYGQEYAAYQEFGTAKMPPQPYVRPTIDQKSDEILKTMGDEMWKELEDKANG
jgi:HK97 gp10 family phage protein